jgi:uncharacterized membrane protein
MYGICLLLLLASELLRLPGVLLFTHLSTLLLFVFSLTHAVRRLGPARAAALLTLVFCVSLLAEGLGVLTGWIFGPFHYTDRLGPKLFGLVPLVIPLAWAMMAYPSRLIAERLLRPDWDRSSTARAAGLALLAAVILSAWDLGMEPVMVRNGHWAWETDGAYYGIPLQNFLGWLATAFCFYFVYGLIAHRLPGPGEGPQVARDDWLAILAYALMGVNTLVFNLSRAQWGAAFLTLVGMGTFAALGFAAAARQHGVRADEHFRWLPW